MARARPMARALSKKAVSPTPTARTTLEIRNAQAPALTCPRLPRFPATRAMATRKTPPTAERTMLSENVEKCGERARASRVMSVHASAEASAASAPRAGWVASPATRDAARLRRPAPGSAEDAAGEEVHAGAAGGQARVAASRVARISSGKL